MLIHLFGEFTFELMNHLMIFLQIKFLTKFFCRKVAMYWMNQIIRTHLIDNSELKPEVDKIGLDIIDS